MYKITLRLTRTNKVGQELIPLKTLDSSADIVCNTDFSDLVHDVRPLIIEALKDIPKQTIKSLKLFYINKNNSSDSFSLWIDNEDYFYQSWR